VLFRHTRVRWSHFGTLAVEQTVAVERFSMAARRLLLGTSRLRMEIRRGQAAAVAETAGRVV